LMLFVNIDCNIHLGLFIRKYLLLW
jgi:hypothetical protein